ncbi:MAG TPA: hypothetical protein VFT85_03370, partial [Acidimicrobiia bacterium]|nr:hypothetical protein [Acidimicrobiia bacterium]
MFSRLLLTTASLLVVALAVLMLDCSTVSVDVFTDDTLGVCSTMTAIGLDFGLWTGLALLLFAGLANVAIWVPTARPGTKKRARLEVTNSLLHNLERIHTVGTQIVEVDEEISTVEIKVARLTRRLEAVEVAVDAAATPSREVTQQWMSLLVEANDLHYDGALATDEFKVI